MSVEYLDKGNDDGTNFGRSDGKIGFYGLTTPIVKQTVTLTVTSATTSASTSWIAGDLVNIKAALAALGLIT